MLSAAGGRLVPTLLMLVQSVFGAQGATISMPITAYALHVGDYAVFQVCNLKPGITVSFLPNPARADTDSKGVLADRTLFTLHIAPSVRAGTYYLLVISYSFVDGPDSWPRIIGYHPRLRVSPNHTAQFPAFNRWYYIPDPDPQEIAPADTCTPVSRPGR